MRIRVPLAVASHSVGLSSSASASPRRYLRNTLPTDIPYRSDAFQSSRS